MNHRPKWFVCLALVGYFAYVALVQTCLEYVACSSSSWSFWESKENDFPIIYHSRSKSVTFDVNNIRFLSTGKPCPEDKRIFLTFCIVSSSSNFEQRRAIRKTWASDTMNNQINYVFIVGRGERDINLKIEEEAKKENDVVFIDYRDVYRNLTFKSVAILKWSKLYCSKSKYIVKIDDDMFVDIPGMFRILTNINEPKVIIGNVFSDSNPRRKRSKWRLSHEDYLLDYFPPYVSGTCYCISTDLLDGLLNAVSIAHVIPLEDVYVTGICGKLAGARLIGHCGTDLHHIPPYKWSSNSLNVIAHKYSSHDLETIWNIRQSLFSRDMEWFKYLNHLLIL